MDDLNELLNNCDGENPRIRHVYDAVMNKYTESGLSKLDEHTPSEAFFITYHLGSGLWLNDDLRNGLKLDTKCKQMFAAYLDEALEKIKSYSGIVYRMDDPNAEARHELDWFKKNIGKTICVPAYLSTSTERWDNQPVTWKIATLKTESFGKDFSKLNKV